MRTSGIIAAVAALAVAGAARAQVPPSQTAPLDAAKAKVLFAEALTVCQRDAGKLWNYSLCGPIMLVDPDNALIVASQADKGGVLKPQDGVFTGKLPGDMLVANTATDWSGTRWTQLIWPFVPTDPATLHVTLGHELFHRIQQDLPIARFNDGANGQMDTLEGRYLLQLEWRALTQALQAKSSAAREAAVADALLFRAERYRRFPSALDDEKGLELNEGVAEYTGVRVGLTTPADRTAYAVKDLQVHVKDRTFVRSFAYATGPAYGLMLDQADPAWRARLKDGPRPWQLLQTALKLPAPVPTEAAVAARAKAYDDGSLRAAEVTREAGRQKRLAIYRAALVDGPVLDLPLAKSNRQFNPSTLVSLDDVGTVYPTVRLTDAWGILEVEAASAGALVYKDFARAAVSLKGADPSGLKGPGWTITLNPGWSVKPGPRPGDMTLAHDGP